MKGYTSEGVPAEKLEESTGLDLNELLNVLKMIDFKGKIVLDSQNFENNTIFFENLMRKFGFSQKNRKDYSSDSNWFAFI